MRRRPSSSITAGRWPVSASISWRHSIEVMSARVRSSECIKIAGRVPISGQGRDPTLMDIRGVYGPGPFGGYAIGAGSTVMKSSRHFKQTQLHRNRWHSPRRRRAVPLAASGSVGSQPVADIAVRSAVSRHGSYISAYKDHPSDHLPSVVYRSTWRGSTPRASSRRRGSAASARRSCRRPGRRQCGSRRRPIRAAQPLGSVRRSAGSVWIVVERASVVVGRPGRPGP